jgi:hypothetical protein
MECSVRMIATLGVVAVIVMLVLGWVMAARAVAGNKVSKGANAVDSKRGEGCECCECAGGACQRPALD